MKQPIGIDVIADITRKSSANVRVSIQTLSLRAIATEQGGSVLIKYKCVKDKLLSGISPKDKVRLNALAYTALKGSATDLETLAACALHAELFEVALQFFQDLARNAYVNGDFSRASRFFQMTKGVLNKIGRAMPSFDKFKLARCYDRIGRQADARRIYETLLAESTTPHADPVLISSICAEISGPYQARRKWDRV